MEMEMNILLRRLTTMSKATMKGQGRSRPARDSESASLVWSVVGGNFRVIEAIHVSDVSNLELQTDAHMRLGPGSRRRQSQPVSLFLNTMAACRYLTTTSSERIPLETSTASAG